MGGYRALGSRVTTQWLAILMCAAVARSADTVPKIEIVEGDGAINNMRLHRAKEPVVRVLDQDGHPMPNVAVTFLLPNNGPGGTFEDGRTVLTVMTDDKGQAVGRGLRPNSSAGQFQIRVTASFGGRAVTANLTQTNAEPASGGGSSKTILLVLLIGGAAAAGAGIALGKGKSSSSSTQTVTNTGAVITPGSPSFGHP